MDVRSKGESGREFIRREATGIHCKEREGRESMCMEECDIVQCGRWDRVIALAGVEEEDPERSTTTPAVPASIWLEVVCTG